MKVTVNARSTIKALQKYKMSLNAKCQEFVSRLIDEGISVAKGVTGEYTPYIKFEKELEPNESGCTGLMIATDGQKIVRQWRYKGEVKETQISPLLMAEFGSGWLAKVPYDGITGVGQGTFPGQKHAFDKDGWRWTTLDNVTHHSRGEAPQPVMFTAILEMQRKINEIGVEVFGNV